MINHDEAQKMRDQGATLQEIADRFKVSHQAVQQYLSYESRAYLKAHAHRLEERIAELLKPWTPDRRKAEAAKTARKSKIEVAELGGKDGSKTSGKSSEVADE